MDSKIILESIDSLKKDYGVLLKSLKKQSILKSKNNFYIKKDKDDFLSLWKKYGFFFKELQSLIKKNKYRSFIIKINYDKLVIRRYLLIFYFEILVETINIFGKHEEFIRVFLKDNIKWDYGYIASYIYKPNFISLINTPSIFINISLGKVKKEFYFMVSKNKSSIGSSKIFFTDYNNFYYYIKNIIFKIVFLISKNIGLIIAKTRFSIRNKGLISKKNIQKYLEIAKPGDILLTRGNWNASNISIPGFWKHMSMYIGKGKFLKETLSFKENKFLKDKCYYVIEATGEGVNIININELLKKNDYLGVSRTTFKKEKVHRAIKSSIKNIGKQYDFIFDFNSDKRLVCSELIMKSYSKEFKGDNYIDIKLENIGVSLTYLPNTFVNLLFKNQKKTNNIQVKPIFFIDSIEKTGENFISTKSEFIKSRKRSRLSFFLK